MTYAHYGQSPGQRLIGLAVVVALHLIFIAALVLGLGRHVTLLKPVALIDFFAVADKTPPQPLPTPPAPKLQQPVQPMIPPPEVVIGAAVPPSNAAPQAITSNLASINAACPNAQGVRNTISYPAAARREGIQGDVVVRFVVATGGDIRNIAVISSSNRSLNQTAIAAVRQFQCVAQAVDVMVEVPFSFRLN